jgi:hypothetical protein
MIPMIRMRLSTLALASVLALPLGTTACSPGQSPTEPAFDEETSAVSASSASSLSSTADESRRGGRGGKNDDNKKDDKGRRGRGRGGDDKGNDDRGNDGGQRAPRGGQEVEGAVASVGASSLTLTNGTRIAVDGSTQWSARGDLFSLPQVSGSLSAGRHPRVEARGTRQSDGSLLATTIKAEDEEDD